VLFIGTLFIDAVKPEHDTRGRANLTGWSIKIGEGFAPPFDFWSKKRWKAIDAELQGWNTEVKASQWGRGRFYLRNFDFELPVFISRRRDEEEDDELANQ
jgi:hypothetical protein